LSPIPIDTTPIRYFSYTLKIYLSNWFLNAINLALKLLLTIMRIFKSTLTFTLLAAICSLSFVACLNQSASNSKSQSLTIKDAKSKWGNGISIQRVNAEVVVTGNIAETTLDLTIANSTSRTLEASLDLPLPEGATISRYALDVNGTMREGVIVDKEKGRVAFENTIRQNIDPGLLEKTKGNNFRTRIYPVPAKGTKRVLLSYTEPMSRHESGAYQYTLPLAIKRRVKDFRLSIASNTGSVRITPIQKKSLSNRANPTSEGYLLERTNYKSSNASFIVQNSGSNYTASALIQNGNDGRNYFYVSQPLENERKIYSRKKVSKLHLVWDSSHSSGLRNHKQDLDLLEAYFEHQQNVSVDLSYLSNTYSKKVRYNIKNGDFSGLRSILERTAYDGATRLDKLDLRGSGHDAVMYVGDGISTLGDKARSVRQGSTPIFTINSSPQANHTLLSQLAKKSGGSYVNLTTSDTQQALAQLISQPYQLLKVTGAGISDVHFQTRSLTASVSGRISHSSSNIKLHYGTNGKTEKVETVNISRAKHQRGGNMAAKLWAQAEVDELSLSAKKNKSRIVSLAKTHRLVTDFTSLIVLDRVSDYVRYRIIPPTADLRKQYYSRLKNEDESNQGKKADLNDVYKNWKRMVKWHQARFPLKKGRSSDEFDWSDPEWDDDEGADFSAPVAMAAPSPAPSFFSGGLRSGDFSITRDSIDAFLNNPSPPKNLTMKLKGWNPDTDYSREMNVAQKAGQPLMPLYLKWKKQYSASSGFYMDAAEIFLKAGQRTQAKRILSNLAEMNPESAELLRILAYRYSQMGEYTLAEMILREVLEMRNEEPQSFRDLALLLAKRKRYSEASKLMWKVVDTEWDSRFDGIKMTVLNEWNQVMRVSGRSATGSQKRFRYSIDADLRVVITWDTDNSDMDLWVTGPDGEKCYYGNTITKRGGKISKDFLRGRGPEEFMVRRSLDGVYKIQANYFGTRQQTLIGPTTLHAKLITNWNRPNQKEKNITIRLGKDKEVIDIGEFSLEQ